MNQVASHSRSASDSAAGSATTIPPRQRDAEDGPGLCCDQQPAGALVDGRERLVGVSPSGEGVVMPARSWPTRPETRTE
jgi:hypothetical protein